MKTAANWNRDQLEDVDMQLIVETTEKKAKQSIVWQMARLLCDQINGGLITPDAIDNATNAVLEIEIDTFHWINSVIPTYLPFAVS